MSRSLFAAALVFLLGVCCAIGASADGMDERLDVLLTNDDGYDAEGLRAMRAALLADGHRVTVVAPSGNRSGASVALTMQGKLAWREVEPGVIAVEGTPADCARLALTVLRSSPPDLVVSGVNFGQNLGSSTVSSGTVGAAIIAADLGVPAIAISQAVDPNDVRGTVRYFPDAAAVTAGLVRLLESAAEGERLLPAGVVLNVNHPPRVRADIAGVKLTRQGRSTLYDLVYTRDGESAVSMAFARSVTPESVPDADTTAVAEGWVSVTPLDGSWNADGDFEAFRGLARSLDSLARSRDAAALE